jgi:hypothetical protein
MNVGSRFFARFFLEHHPGRATPLFLARALGSKEEADGVAPQGMVA